ncbi:hypothetical protein GZ77_16485 [Endozoicomonas montiporae]|uniref:Uncharacterized protein n=3 Tax=Endozoicomonas montiporae TaxID=1027273 RepID=A0A081N5Y6_9GAMM|nr:HlyD family efflux transporter periplasmic adaptor subunit [Endozoicomonas montiporae]AMO57231.1 hypothetical protein EZMO1_3231 [Endozoicomonas montiporae CL-33]KEQ13859.1 hypothetical protein GZ77_16485 [Endozoicomonas montiporae]
MSSQSENNPYLRLIALEKELRQATNETELQLIMVNRLRSLIEARHLMLFRLTAAGKLRLCRCSDTGSVDQNSSSVMDLESIAQTFHSNSNPSGSQSFPLESLDAAALSRLEWLQDSCLWIPVIHPDGKTLGYLWLNRQSGFTEQEQVLANHIAETFAHAWKATMPVRRQWLSIFSQHRFRWAVVVFLVVLMFFPVRLSVLAPAEVMAFHPELATAPLNGVVREILVKPNDRVQKGQPLVAFEDTRLRNQLTLAQEELQVAEARLRKVQQQSFTDPGSTGELAELQATVQLKQAELDYARELLDRSLVKSLKAGIAVFRDEDDWSGRPVQQGERILYVADPGSVEIQIMLPVRDAITLEAGTVIKLFLDTDPLNPLSATLRYASYDAEVTPQNVLAYRLKASFSDTTDLPRIGLQGTAKLYGERSSLFIYLFRRPLAFLRQWLGM